MSQSFDPYHIWLGIQPKDQPPNHYRLLGLSLFESNFEVIRDAAQRQLAHVRRYMHGEHKELAEQICAEIAKARLCLLQARERELYDETLRSGEPLYVEDDFSRPSHSSDIEQLPAGTDFDPYYRWLGIPSDEQPADSYRLLGVERLERDLEVIREAAERQIAHVRKYTIGNQRATAVAILRSLVKARSILLDVEKKRQYDQQLDRVASGSDSRATELTGTNAERVSEPIATQLRQPSVGTKPPKDIFQTKGLPAVLLSTARSMLTLHSRQLKESWSAWGKYVVSGVGGTVLLVILLTAGYRNLTSIDLLTGNKESPGHNSTEEAFSPSVLPANLAQIRFAPPRNGNPLLDYHRLATRFDESGIEAVVREYPLDSHVSDVRLVRRALELSRDILRDDPSQLWSQLQARTVAAGGVPLSNFDTLRPSQPYWESETASFWQADGPLVLAHPGAVRPPVLYSHDGRRLICAARFGDGRVFIWDLHGDKKLSTLCKHFEYVQAMAISPDGKSIVSASRGELQVTNLETHDNILKIDLPRDNLSDVVLSPDGTICVVLLAGHSIRETPIRVLDLTTGTELYAVGERFRTKTVAVTSDGTRLVADARSGIKVWNLADGREIYTLDDYSTPITVSSDSQLLGVKSDRANAIALINLQTGTKIIDVPGPDVRLEELNFTFNDSHILATYVDGSVRLLDARSGSEVSARQGHITSSLDSETSPDSKTVITKSQFNTLELFRPASNSGPTTLAPTAYSQKAITFSPDSQRFVTVSGTFGDGIKGIHVWDPAGRPQQHFLQDLPNAAPVAISADGERIAYMAGADGTIERKLHILNIDTATTVKIDKAFDGRTNQLHFSPNGEFVVTSSTSRTTSFDPVEIWTRDGHLQTTLVAHDSSARRVAFTTDGSLLASAGDDGTLKIWDRNGKEQRTISGHNDRVHSVVIASDNERALTASRDTTMRMWDLQTGVQLKRIEVGKPVYSAKLTADGTQVVANVANESLQVWDLSTGVLERSFAPHVGPFSILPDNKSIVSYNGSTIVIRDLTTGLIRLTIPTESRINACTVLSNGTLAVVEDSGRIHRLRVLGL